MIFILFFLVSLFCAYFVLSKFGLNKGMAAACAVGLGIIGVTPVTCAVIIVVAILVAFLKR